MKFLVLGALALLMTVSAAGAQTLDRIRKQGTVRLGYVEGAAPFSSAENGGEPQGYSVELCRAVVDGLAEQLKRESLPIQWVKLTLQNRIEAVRKKQVDIECGTATWTLSRQQLVDFSLITFVDGGSLLVGAQSEISQLRDLEGKRIAVIAGTTTEPALRAALERGSVKAELVSIKTRDEGLNLLAKREVEALASDRTALIGLVVMSGGAKGNFKLLDQDFSIEQYALMLPRGDADFRLAVNRVLARIYRSGEIEKIYARWLGPLGPPSVLLSATYYIQSISE
ncbi:MAG TPA: amino acid ABC transporter substrate-binding protein [Polyangiaceae bacterium]|nr:amino acid ABC transporter substrate-binding protein [Polyangiaceae bacterium]